MERVVLEWVRGWGLISGIQNVSEEANKKERKTNTRHYQKCVLQFKRCFRLLNVTRNMERVCIQGGGLMTRVLYLFVIRWACNWGRGRV